MGTCESSQEAPTGDCEGPFEVCPEDAFDAARYTSSEQLLQELFELMDINNDGVLNEIDELERFSIYMSADERVQYLRTFHAQHYGNGDGNISMSFAQWAALPVHAGKTLPQLLDTYACLLRGFAQDILNAVWEHLDLNRNGVAEPSEIESFVNNHFTQQAAVEQRNLFQQMGAGELSREQLVGYVASCTPKRLREMYGKLLQDKGVMQLEPEYTEEELISAVAWKFPSQANGTDVTRRALQQDMRDAERVDLVEQWKAATIVQLEV